MSATANIACFDVETGGLNCRKNPITQIALQAFRMDTLEEIVRYDSYVIPYMDEAAYEKAALDYTGITLDMLHREGKPLNEVVKGLCDAFAKANTARSHTKKPVVLGHNVNFDNGFLCKIFDICKTDLSKLVECGKEDAWGNKTPIGFDTMWLSRQKWANDPTMLKYNLTACCQRAGIEIVDSHAAQNDVTATKELFVYLTNHLRTGSSSSKESESARPRVKFQF